MEKYLELNALTVDETLKVLNEMETRNKLDPLTLKCERVKQEWDSKTEIPLEDVLELYSPCIKTIYEKVDERYENSFAELFESFTRNEGRPGRSHRHLSPSYLCNLHDA